MYRGTAAAVRSVVVVVQRFMACNNDVVITITVVIFYKLPYPNIARVIKRLRKYHVCRSSRKPRESPTTNVTRYSKPLSSFPPPRSKP